MNGRTEPPGKRIGIFGGTFDPPHIAHRVLAMEACDQLGLDTLLWVLTAVPPHKQDHNLTPVEARLELVMAAIGDDPHFVLSRVEIDRPGPHYAADTLRLLAGQFPQAELCYLIGGDSLRDLPHWHRPHELLAYCNCLGVMRRPHDRMDMDQMEADLPGIRDKIRTIHTPMMEVSSTDIRERIRNGRLYRYYLPDGVYRVIEARGYYR